LSQFQKYGPWHQDFKLKICFAASADGKEGKSFKAFSVSNQDDHSSEITATIEKNNNNNNDQRNPRQVLFPIKIKDYSYLSCLYHGYTLFRVPGEQSES
jgi:hypothetical protein